MFVIRLANAVVPCAGGPRAPAPARAQTPIGDPDDDDWDDDDWEDAPDEDDDDDEEPIQVNRSAE